MTRGVFRVALRTFLTVNNTFWKLRPVEGNGGSSVAGSGHGTRPLVQDSGVTKGASSPSHDSDFKSLQN